MGKVTVKGLARSSASAVGAEVWRIGTRIVLTPVIIAQIGLEGYGVWALLFSVCSYVSVVHTGFGLAYSKFTAEYDAKRDYAGLSEIIGAGILLVGAFGFIALGGLWLVRFPLLTLLGVPQSLLPSAGSAFLLVALCVLMNMSVGCVFQILSGIQRMDLRYKVKILASGIEFAVAIILLSQGRGLLALAIGHLCGQVAGILVAWIACRHLCPAIRISPLNATVLGIRRVVSLGGRFQLLHTLTVVTRSGVKLLISALLGAATLGVFELARKLLALGDAAAAAVVAPMMPAFAHVAVAEGSPTKHPLYERWLRLLVVVSIVSFGFLAVFADRLVVLWTEHAYPAAGWTVRCLAVAFAVKQLTGMGTAVLRAKGMIGLEMGYALVNTTVLAALIVPAHLLWGYEGMVVSVAVGLTAGSVWFLVAFNRLESLGFLSFLRRTVTRPLLVLTPVLVLAGLFERYVRPDLSVLHGRLDLLMDLLFCGALYALASTLCAWYGVLSRAEREALMRTTRWSEHGPPAERTSAKEERTFGSLRL